MHPRDRVQRLVIGLLVTALAPAGVSAQTSGPTTSPATSQPTTRPSTRQGNVWGVCLGFEPGWDTTGNARLLGLARALAGDWGYIRSGIAPSNNVDAVRRDMAMIRAYHLIPISGGAAPDPAHREPGKEWPRRDPDGTTRTAARAKAAVWKKMYDAGIPFYVIEVLNEINGHWPPEIYAQYLYDLAVEVKKAYPGLKVCSCGMAGSGADYYDKLLTIKPELKDVVDFWGLHPYGANHPPDFRVDDVSLRAYELTAAVLEKHGVDPIRMMCTETGYELEFSDTGKDSRYPPIDEENRAEYMALAFTKYYVPDPRIECVTPFMLWDFPWHNWNGWDFMYHDGRPKPIYEALAAVQPKPGGRDWMPTGPGRIAGRITWRDTDIGVPRMIVYTEPGLYGAVTDDEGRYEITGLPAGRYRVQAFRSGYKETASRAVDVRGYASAASTDAPPAAYDATTDRVSLVGVNFGPAGRSSRSALAQGWTPTTPNSGPDVFLVDPTVSHHGRATQRVKVTPGRDAGAFTFGNYASAYPSEVFIGELYVRGRAMQIEPGGGPWFAVELTSGRGEVLSSAKAYASDFKPDGKWYRITAAAFGPARASRVRISFGVENADGAFWFSEPFVGEADFPLPTDDVYRTTGYVPPLYDLNKRFFAQAVADIERRSPKLTTATLTGVVSDFRGRPQAHAAVATDAPLFVTVTDEHGRYELTAPARQRMRVRAFALGEVPAVSEPVTLDPGESRMLDLQTAPPPAPAELVNGGFNAFHEREAGLLSGWQTFGTTDGACGSGRMIFEVPAYEGKGLYFAQSGSNTKNGGAYQIVQAKPGRRYRLWGYVYTRTVGEHAKPLDNNCRLGIDPTGGRDADSADVVWTEPTESEQKWTRIEVEATATTSRLTVYVRHEMRRGNTWNLTLFDGVHLEPVGN